MENRSDYLKYKKGDVSYEDSLCAFCKHFNPDKPTMCIKYPEGKPDEVLKSEIRCDYLEIKDI